MTTLSYGLDVRLWNERHFSTMAQLIRILLLFIYLSFNKSVIFCQVFPPPWNTSSGPSDLRQTFNDGRTKFGIRPFEGDGFFKDIEQNRRIEPNFRSIDSFSLERRPTDDDLRAGNRDFKPDRPRWTRPSPGWNNPGQVNPFPRRPPPWTPAPFITTKPPNPWYMGKPAAWILNVHTDPPTGQEDILITGHSSSSNLPRIPDTESSQNSKDLSTKVLLPNQPSFSDSQPGIPGDKTFDETTTLSLFDYPEVSGFITNITADSSFFNVSNKPERDMKLDDANTGRMIASGTRGMQQSKNKVLWLKIPTADKDLDIPSDSSDNLQDIGGDPISDPDKDNGNKKNRVLWMKVTTALPGFTNWMPADITTRISIDDIITEPTNYPPTTKYRRRKSKIMTKPTNPTVVFESTPEEITTQEIKSKWTTTEATNIPMTTESTTASTTTKSTTKKSTTASTTTESTTASTTTESTTATTTTESTTVPTTTESTTIPTTESTTKSTQSPTTKYTTLSTTTEPITTTITTTTTTTKKPVTRRKTTTIATSTLLSSTPTTTTTTIPTLTTLTEESTMAYTNDTTTVAQIINLDVSSIRNTSLSSIKAAEKTNLSQVTEATILNSTLTLSIKQSGNKKPDNLTNFDVNNKNLTKDVFNINTTNLNDSSRGITVDIESKDLNATKPFQQNNTTGELVKESMNSYNANLNNTTEMDINKTNLTNIHNRNKTLYQNGSLVSENNPSLNISTASFNTSLSNTQSERRLDIITNETNTSNMNIISSGLDANRSGRIIGNGKTINEVESLILNANSEIKSDFSKSPTHKNNTNIENAPRNLSKVPILSQLPFTIPKGSFLAGFSPVTEMTHYKVTKRIFTTNKPSTIQSITISPAYPNHTTSTNQVTENLELPLYTTTANPNSISWKSSFRIIDGADWHPNLANKYSPEYQTLEASLIQLLDNFFKNTLAPDYGSVHIQSFRKGSIVVDFILYVKSDYLSHSDDQKRLKEDFLDHLSEHGGKLGNYTIDDSQVEFEVLGNPRMDNNLNVEYTVKTSTLLPQWAVATIVIGCSTIIFIIIFVAVMSYHKTRNKRRFGKRLQDMESVSKSWEKISAYEDIQQNQPDVLYSMDDVFEQGATNPGRKKRLAALQNREMSLDPRLRELRERERLREMKERELQRARMMKDPRMQVPHHAAYYNKGLQRDVKGSWDSYM